MSQISFTGGILMKKIKEAYYKIITDHGTTIMCNGLFMVMKH